MYYHSNNSGCINDAGYKCKFPIEHGEQLHFDCIKGGKFWSDKTWCYDVRGNTCRHGIMNDRACWDYCSNCSMGSQKLIAHKNEL